MRPPQRWEPETGALHHPFMRFCVRTIGILAATGMMVMPVFSQLPPPTDSPAGVPAQAPPVQSPPAFERPVSWKLMLPNLLSDQERIWTFPARLVKGQNWVPAAATLGATAGFIAFDPTEAAYFHQTTTFHGFNNILSGNATAIGTLMAPVSLYAIGLVRHDTKMEGTALLAGEAAADAEIVTLALKEGTRRLRPSGVQPGGNYSDTWYDGSGSLFQGHGSFPSGHTIAAFSIATVVARRYRNHRWVPYTAYGMAMLVGFSRLSLSAHFLSDVFMGGALGYSISRFAVLRQ